MLWRWRILAVVLALAAARIVYGWPPRPVWTVALHEPTRWELASKPLGFWAGDTVFATGIHAPDRDTFRLSHWSVATGDCLETREIKPEPALGAPLWLSRVSPCGRFLALSGFDRPVTTRRTSVWLIDLNTGETLCHHPINDPCVNQAAFLAFSRDGEWLAFVEPVGPGICLVPTSRPQALRRLTVPGRLVQVGFSPDSKFLAVHSWPGPCFCELIDLESGTAVLRLNNAMECFFLADGRVVTFDHKVRTLCTFTIDGSGATETGTELRLDDYPTREGHAWWPIRGQGRGLIIENAQSDPPWKNPQPWRDSSTFFHFNLDTGQCERRGFVPRGLTMYAVINHDGSLAATSTTDGYVQLWDTRTPRWHRWPWVVLAALVTAGATLAVGRWHTLRWREELQV